jgi:hypothetical protein
MRCGESVIVIKKTYPDGKEITCFRALWHGLPWNYGYSEATANVAVKLAHVKVLDVIASCKTIDQMDIADRYIAVFKAFYNRVCPGLDAKSHYWSFSGHYKKYRNMMADIADRWNDKYEEVFNARFKPNRFYDEMSFVDRCIADDFIYNIYDYIDYWNECDSAVSLHEFLGMTKSEYILFVMNYSALPGIISGRLLNNTSND